MSNVTLRGKLADYQFGTENPIVGGTGNVYKGIVISSKNQDIPANSRVAVKVLYRDMAKDIMNIIRDENTTKIKVKHKNLLRVYEFIELKGRYHTISEWLEGETLNKRIELLRSKGTALDAKEIDYVIHEILAGVEELHQQDPPVYHRDIKPANVMLCIDGSIKLIDFGAAKIKKDNSEYQTVIGSVLGTPNYAAPEQILGKHDQINASSDIYAIGNTIYELFLGVPPFEGAQFEVMDKQVNSPLPSLVDSIPEPYRSVVKKATQKAQKDRYPDVSSLRGALTIVNNNEPEISISENLLSSLPSINIRDLLLAAFWTIVLVMSISMVVFTYVAVKPTLSDQLSMEDKAKFEHIVKEADSLYRIEQKDAACQKYKEAQIIWPDPGLQLKILNSCNK